MDNHPELYHHFLTETKKLFLHLRAEMGPQVKDQLEVTRSEWAKLVHGGDMNYGRFEEILSRLGLSSLSFMAGEIDYGIACLHLSGDRSLASNQYHQGARSSRRIGRILLQILKDYYGAECVRKVQLAMQVGDDYFLPEHDHCLVNTEMYGKLYKILRTFFGFTEENLFWLGQTTAYYNMGTSFANKFQSPDLATNYAHFLEEVSAQIEKSYRYQLVKLNDREAVIKKTLNPDVMDELKKKIYGNTETCIYSTGFCTAIAYFSQGKFPAGKMVDCLYSNHTASSYRIDFTQLLPGQFSPPRALVQ